MLKKLFRKCVEPLGPVQYVRGLYNSFNFHMNLHAALQHGEPINTESGARYKLPPSIEVLRTVHILDTQYNSQGTHYDQCMDVMYAGAYKFRRVLVHNTDVEHLHDNFLTEGHELRFSKNPPVPSNAAKPGL